MSRAVTRQENVAAGYLKNTNAAQRNSFKKQDPRRTITSDKSTMDTSMMIESSSVITKTDQDGTKHINQYMLLEKLGKYSIKLFLLEEAMEL